MSNQNTKNAAYVGLFATLVMVGAFTKIPTPIIPFTLQFLFVCLAGFLLGAKKGFLSVFIYAALGLAGLPIFTGGGGITYVLQPTFGYIVGFIICAYTTGLISEKLKPTLLNYTIAAVSGLIILHIIGVPYYYFISHNVINNNLSFSQIFLFCFVYTFPFDFILSIISARLALRLKPFINK